MDDLRMTSDDRRHQVVTVLLDILKSFSMQCEVSGNLIFYARMEAHNTQLCAVVLDGGSPALACHVSHRSLSRCKNCSNHLAARQPDDHASALRSRAEPGPLGRAGGYAHGVFRAADEVFD